jgi:hypothetical protein
LSCARARQPTGKTRALGAVVEVSAGGRTQIAQVGADGSYLSQHSTDLHFGLGEATSADVVEITWPDGTRRRHEDVAADRLHTFVR